MDRRRFLSGLMGSTAMVALWPQQLMAAVEERALPIPQLLSGEVMDGVRVFKLSMQRGVHEFFKGVKTPTLGINASYLGSTLRVRDGEKVRFEVSNNIGEITTLHWHGMHLPASADGGPHQVIQPGTTWSPQFEIKQRASTLWYHSHTHKQTGNQVWRGLAGMLIVDDVISDGLDVPKQYGVDDIPIVLQERIFNRDGSLYYDTGSMHNVMMGMKGDVPIVNGAVAPTLIATTEKLRLRILNGSNSSFYNLGFDDNRRFTQIASDGGYLPRAYQTGRMLLGPGERGEIVVDVSDGKTIFLRNFGGGMGGGGMMMGGGDDVAFNFMAIRPAGNLAKSNAVPSELVKVEPIAASSAARVRKFELQMTMGPQVMMGFAKPFAINGKAMDMNQINEVVKLGDTEIWEIANTSMMAHPFHVHLIQFQILDRNGRRPHPGEQGLKDTVIVNPGETVRVIARFENYADEKLPYMYHCHILEHEDAGMMGQFTVVA